MTLSDRRQRVLAALIEEYVSRALPVGSRTLTEHYHLGVSAATVRNELSVLEDAGFIAQPHTSAGRVPTDYGYRAFVDDLLRDQPDAVDTSAQEAIRHARQTASELDDLMEQTTSALASLTECLSIVVPPSSLSLNVKQISLVSITDYRVLIVIVGDDGQVLNRNVQFSSVVDCDALAISQDVLNKVVSGRTFAQMRDGLDATTLEQLQDPLTRLLLDEVLHCLADSESGRAHSIGLSTLLRQPEFTNSQELLPVMQVLEDNTVLLHMLDQVEASDEPIVRIGHENENELLNGVSVIAGQYGHGDSAGLIAVIGPTRMNYSQVISAVRGAQRELDEE